jgi:hypothetical protein
MKTGHGDGVRDPEHSDLDAFQRRGAGRYHYWVRVVLDANVDICWYRLYARMPAGIAYTRGHPLTHYDSTLLVALAEPVAEMETGRAR